MEKMKMHIELNNYSYGEDMLYAAVGLRGGYATRDYITNETTHFASNCAFYNILFNYYQITNEVNGTHYDVQRAVSTISFCEKADEFIPKLNDVLHNILNHNYTLEIFEKAKGKTKENFAVRYKNGAFRAKLKGLEIADLNKCFTLKRLIDDIEEIDYETFVKCSHALLVLNNICVYILGETDGLDFSRLLLEQYEDQYTHTVHIAGKGYDPYLRQDAYVTNIARENHNVIIEAFDFLNADVTNFAKLLLVEMYAELIPEEEMDIWVDSLDASIIFSTERLQSYKGCFLLHDENSFEVVRKKLLTKYVTMIKNRPEHFAIKAVGLMTIGVYIDMYLEFLDKCSCEMFKEISEKADYKITEAQVVLRKESK